ncbi:MAG: pyridoxamine 5'-phosphate oxidase family protein [Desulfobacteraceae bacterium]|jgi:nitroimidazol reductase NimA-like FMN-containing flavoprotein (pyridoxamine 5'-phosphate oxidase superfamily)
MASRKIIKSCEEIEKIICEETMGFLGLCMDGVPYVVPLTYAYVEGRILFHCALKGKKLDYIKANPQVCFTVGKQFEVCRHPHGARCRASHDSVICYGTARVVENMEERLEVLNRFNRCLQPDAKEIPIEAVSKCYAVEIKITKMTGRQQRKGTEWTHWEYNFE